jgi:hypothetical protein
MFHIFHLNFHHVMSCICFELFNSFPASNTCFISFAVLRVEVAALQKTIRIYFMKFNFYFTWSIYIWFKIAWRRFFHLARFRVFCFNNIEILSWNPAKTSSKTIELLKRQIKACNYAHLSSNDFSTYRYSLIIKNSTPSVNHHN